MKIMSKKLKPWITNLLIIIGFVSVLIASSECSNNLVFIVKSVISCFIFSINSYILVKYGSL